MKKKQVLQMPSADEVEKELQRVKYRHRYQWVFRTTVYTLVTVAAVAVLVATLWMPVIEIYGNSMTPTLEDGDIVVSLKGEEFQSGDIIAFYYNNKLLIKRVIATTGDWIEMEDDGTVFVNGEKLEEPYLEEKAYGDCNIEFPYQVPESRVFVMGDHRSISIDSRNTSIGCIAEEQIVGKLTMRVWPFKRIEVF